MALETKYFKLNDLDLIQYTFRVRDTQDSEAGTVAVLGEEQRQFAEDNLGVRRIAWEGFVSNDDLYIKLRKALFCSSEKILHLHPDRFIVLKSVRLEKFIDLKKPEDSTMTISMLAADTREFDIAEQVVSTSVSASPAPIEITSKGSAPAQVKWTITAVGSVINPTISDGINEMEWFGTLSPGDVMIISKEGEISINGTPKGSVSGSIAKASPGLTSFVFQDDASSSHNCTVKAVWNDAYY